MHVKHMGRKRRLYMWIGAYGTDGVPDKKYKHNGRSKGFETMQRKVIERNGIIRSE